MLKNVWILCSQSTKSLTPRAREKQAEKPLFCYISDFKVKKIIKARPLALIYNYGCGELDLLYNLYYGLASAVLQLAARKIREGTRMDNFPANEQAQ